MFINVPPRPVNSLPLDNELITYFELHRADLEELARRYRGYVPDPGTQQGEWRKRGDIPEVFRRAGVSYVSPIMGRWMPDLYSVEARQREGNLSYSEFNKPEHQVLVIQFADRRFNHNIIWKDLVSFPVTPRIEEGFLIGPVDKEGKNSRYLVYASLDSEPPLIKRDLCGFRRIESKWFIRMCRIIK